MSTTRRSWLEALGVGGTAAVAGCVSAPSNDRRAARQRKAVENAAQGGLARVAAEPMTLPGPLDRNEPTEVDITLRTEEITAEIEPGVEFTFMTYGGQVPGPFIRVMQGDTINLTFENAEGNVLPHNVDFHACAGPGGGAGATMTAPGETTQLRFQATYPGAFIYHCAVPNLDMHISAGMFGLILVEPPEGLPEVDHEVYLGQHEIYTKQKAGEKGTHTFDMAGMRREDPTYVVMNGGKFAITDDHHGAIQVGTDETVRIFLVVGGPNLTSNFHPIGSVWDEFWPQGAIVSEPHRYVQTWPVSPGSTAVATMNSPVPGDFKLVDHALSRVARKGCMAIVHADGPENSAVFDPDPQA